MKLLLTLVADGQSFLQSAAGLLSNLFCPKISFSPVDILLKEALQQNE
jgi:hypothetical protein